MYERFTDRARKVMQLANQEAQRFNHEYIGTEHILLGLVREGLGVAANVLKNLDIDLRKIRLEVEAIVQRGPRIITTGKLPQTPRAKKVIEYSIEEARNLGHNYVSTEHLLLGLLREEEAVAAQVLMNLGLRLEHVREEIVNLLGQSKPDRGSIQQAADEEHQAVCAGLMSPPWQSAGGQNRFEHCCFRTGAVLGRHQNLAIFVGGLLATFLGARVGLDVAGLEDPNPGALFAGLCYLAAVAIGCCSASRCGGSSCQNR
jgi:ATP-dependent Clp protease ATP-binding subunit ClpA